MAETIEIVRLDAAGNVVETLVDHVPAGWSAARTELGKLRHGEAGTQAHAEGGWLELRVGGVAKMSTKAAALEPEPEPKTKKRPSSEQPKKPAKKPATKKKKQRARPPSTSPSGAVKLPPRLWGRVFGYVDDSLDDLGRVKAVACVVLCSKTLQTRLQAGGGELWDPLVDKIAAVAPCVKWAANEKNRRPIEVARRNELLAKPWLPLATLSTTCVQCRAVTVRSVHATYGVRICSGCCKKKVGLVVATEAKGKYRVTDTDLRGLPFTTRSWYGKESKLYLLRHVKLAQARRFGSKAKFEKVDASRKPYNPGHLSFFYNHYGW